MTPDEILMQIASMWKGEITWMDNDRKEHTTTFYTTFELTDEVMELMLEAQGKAFGCSIDNPISQEITPPLAME